MLICAPEDIKSIVKNCLQVNVDSGKISFERFTQKQFSAYAHNPSRKIRSYCPSGICLDFYTDSQYIKFNYELKDRARNWFYFDIFINDIFVKSIGSSSLYSNSGNLDVTIQTESCAINRVTIYLPHVLEITLQDIQLSDGSFIRPTPKHSKNLLCLGDSITQGMDCKNPSSTYPVLLSRYFDANLLNQGVGGHVFDKSSLDEKIPYEPDLITAAYGTNDWSACDSMTQFSQNASEYLELLTKIFPQSQILVITPIWRKDLHALRSMGSFFALHEELCTICRRFPRVTVVNGIPLVPNDEAYFGDKSLHPNSEGFLHYAFNLAREISRKKLL